MNRKIVFRTQERQRCKVGIVKKGQPTCAVKLYKTFIHEMTLDECGVPVSIRFGGKTGVKSYRATLAAGKWFAQF